MQCKCEAMRAAVSMGNRFRGGDVGKDVAPEVMI